MNKIKWTIVLGNINLLKCCNFCQATNYSKNYNGSKACTINYFIVYLLWYGVFTFINKRNFPLYYFLITAILINSVILTKYLK